MEIKNRFVRSATHEAMATETGEVTDKLVRMNRNLAKGGVGLVIPGYAYVQASGRTYKYQNGIHDDDTIPGLERLVNAVHEEGGRIVLQLVHAGRQTTKSVIGNSPIAPSSVGRDPVNQVKPKEMTVEEIHDVIRAFGDAARRADEAGADGIQIHAAHGYLVNQFLSPFFNRREDEWGGSAENRFRFLKEVITETRSAISKGKAVLVKLNTNDHTPQEGVTPPLAVEYAKWLVDLGIDALEISCGTGMYSFMQMCQGEVPMKELLQGLPLWKRPFGWFMLRKFVGKHDLQEGYNLDAARMIKPVLGTVPLILVGGLRRMAHMEEVLEQGYADFVSMSRPFLREPSLVKKFQNGETEASACISCNRCLAAVPINVPVLCYRNRFPRP